MGLDQDIGSIEKGKISGFYGSQQESFRRHTKYKFGTMDDFEWSRFDSATMNQIYPTSIEREPLYFENESLMDKNTRGHFVWMRNTLGVG